MFYKKMVQEALRRCLLMELKSGSTIVNPASGQDSVISQLIHDLFGGEILKTPERRGWHFYNRIDGERVDFAGEKTSKNIRIKKFKDIPVSPAETSNYFDFADYFSFLMRFVRTFEESVGLRKSMNGLPV